jgi:hypothetical protein
MSARLLRDVGSGNAGHVRRAEQVSKNQQLERE